MLRELISAPFAARVAAPLAAVAALVTPCSGMAQDTTQYPSKAIKIIVAASPGGTSDILARTIGLEMTKRWKQPVVIENKPGADSNLGADFVAKAPADGYTLLLMDTSTLTMGPSFYPKLSYDPAKDFAPITMVVFSPHLLGVHPSVPVSNVPELNAYSKKNPGKLNLATATNASRIGVALFNQQTGSDLMPVPYKGGAASINAVVGGESNVILNGLLATLPQVKSGRVKAIATASTKRMQATPEIPTVIEGGVPGFVTGSWQGVLAPAATPISIIQKLNTTLVEILKQPDVNQKFVDMGSEVVGNTPAEFGKQLSDETTKWAKVFKDGGIKPE